MFKKLSILALAAIATSCATRAPSNYELDRRSGMVRDLPGDKSFEAEISKIRTGTDLGKDAYMPARVPAIIEKVWIYDQKIGDHWMQGTWVFVEVEGEKWLPELDTGYGSLLEEKKSITTKSKVLKND